MSFHRISHGVNPSKRPLKKKAVKKKPQWDDTLHDLTTFKATDEDLERRKTAHKSKNHMTYKLQQMRKVNKREENNGQITQNQARQLAIMKEILYDQRQLKSVLDKTDNMMSVVKDLFGDDPKKYKGFPNVTSAPNASGDHTDRNTSLVSGMPEIYTKTEALSDSVMNPTALNDLPDSDSDDDETDNPHPIVYHQQMNLHRFQQFLANEEKNQTLSSIGGQAQLSHNEIGPTQSTQIQGNSGFETPPNEANDSMEIHRPPRSAINDTNKVRKIKSRIRDTSTSSADTSQTQAMNLTDMRKVLESLQDEIAEFEKQTGTKIPAEKQRSDTFTGYTVALVDSVSKLARYLRETDRRLQAEITVREQLTQDVHQMRTIIDALTSDIIVTQEEYGRSQGDFLRYRQQTEQELALLKAALYGIKGPIPTPQLLNSTRTPPQHHPDMHFTDQHQNPETSHLNAASSLPQPNIEQLPLNLRSSIPSHLHDDEAILLSPPVRKTRVHDQLPQTTHQTSTQPLPFQQNRQTSLIDLPSLANSQPTSTTSTLHPSVVNVPRPISLAQRQQNSQLEAFSELSRPSNGVSQGQQNGSPHRQHVELMAMQGGQQQNVIQNGQYRSLPGQVMLHGQPDTQSQNQSLSQSQIPQNSDFMASLASRHPNVSFQGTQRNPMKEEGMKTQIAELNKQHEEAQKRLHVLLVQQQQQKVLLQQDQHQRQLGRGHDQVFQELEASTASGQLSQSLLNQQKDLIKQQQEIAHLLERQSESFANQNNNNADINNAFTQQEMLQQQEYVMRQMHEQMKRIQDQQQSMGFDIHKAELQQETALTPPKRDQPQGDSPFSPPISPISQQSDNYVTLQNQYLTRQPTSRIQVSIPKVDFDKSF
ncbi:hypothetical protein LOTGIDRAFT_234670 [Lottia gigantea]|uniref:Spindle and centriole-associated protein 1 n=1 Tax=Lottia gigantea TaxID=225164 RepID=V4BHH1_LOTGI|nr:hypothetical protein LOTGIDRAFT_234670 [Lottia gigantea]ESO88089.1 hypothetical protein LOTGIDRAFT_234670 [Lottia gigantea]